MSKYTAQDFEDAQFAEHPDGRLAHRVEYGTVFSWSFERNDADDYAANEYMVADGWAPVPAQRTVTDSEYDDAAKKAKAASDIPYWNGRALLYHLGIKIVAGPEPTNAEKLADAITNASHGVGIGSTTANIKAIAKHLDEAGVKAPGGDDEQR